MSSEEQVLPFTITVLEGELANQVIVSGEAPGVIPLRGAEMPYRPISYTGKQRVKTTWYAGNPVATQQVIGPTEEPTRVSGTWKDVKLGAGRARQLVDIFDDIRRRGVSVEVSWGDGLDSSGSLTAGPLVRVGVITESKWSPDRPQDWRWELEFTWRGQVDSGGTAPVFDATTPTSGFTDAVDALEDATSNAQSLMDVVQTIFGLPYAVLAQVNAALENVTVASTRIDQATAAISAAQGLSSSVARSVSSAASLGLQSLIDLETTILSIRPTDLLPSDDALGYVVLKDQLLQLLGVISDSKEKAYDAAQAAQAQVDPDVIAEVRVAAGVDLRDLAFKYYGDPDSWWTIAEFNDLDSSAVPSPPGGPSDDPGLPLKIPRLQPGASSSLPQAC